MSRSTQFFATRSDLERILAIAESKKSLQYVKAGRFRELPAIVYRYGDIPNLGVAPHESSVLCDRYLVIAAGLNIQQRTISTSDDVFFDQLLNPNTILFNSGGLWKDNILLRGYIGTASADPDSLTLMRIFKSAVKMTCLVVNGNFVGNEAERLWRQGMRLTGAEQSPKEYDLTAA